VRGAVSAWETGCDPANLHTPDPADPGGRVSVGDFHCHSDRSDGTRSPADLVDLAASHGVRVFALTDHDTIDGLEEAAEAVARHPGMRLIPGVEFGCYEPGTEVHILGLFIDPSNG